jgi:hypothetical protein
MGTVRANLNGALAAEARLPPPPRAVQLRWASLLGPNFPYFLHVAIFSLIPVVIAVWLAFVMAWITLGHDVDGKLVYVLSMDGPGGGPRDQVWVEYRVGDTAMRADLDGMSHSQLSALGMADEVKVVPGVPIFTTKVPVHVLSLGWDYFAEPMFPWTWLWKRMIVPALFLFASLVGMVILHGELYRIIPLDLRLIRHGLVTKGQLLATHETGWWQASGEYSWTYIRRIYADYSFTDPATGRERRGCQLVLGALDPAQLPEGFRLGVLYDPARPERHIVYEFSPFATREA